MFERKSVYKDMANIHVYTAKKLSDMAGSLEELAKRLRRSPRQTQRLLLEYYGKSYQQKKAEAKMSAAALLLADKSKNMASISEELGYSSPEHFSAAFRGYYGTTPREYRKGL